METLINIPDKTVKDYLPLPEGAPYQLINGQLIMSPAPKRSHQKLAVRIIDQQNVSILTEDGAEGAPDVVIEILSPSNAYYDVRAKLQLYEKVGVKEYFILDPQDNMVVSYTLTDACYKESYRESNKIISAVLGTEILWA